MALRKDGWLLRDLVVWSKPHPKPEPRKNRRFTAAHEIIIRVAKTADYYFDVDAIEQLGLRNNVWTFDTVRATHGHPAAYPPQLVAGCLLAACPPGGIILYPFMGSGTTAVVAQTFGRHFVGYDTSQSYADIAQRRLKQSRLVDQDFPLTMRPYVSDDRQSLELFA